MPKPQHKLLLSIGVLSAAIIAFQIALIQVLSIVQWYHFAYMVISIAMLGFGGAATALAIFTERLSRHAEILLPVLMIVTGMGLALVTGISQSAFVRFDSYLLFAAYSQIANLLLTYLLFFIPFFTGALAIGLVFIKHVGDIGKVYFANLLGSGGGGILALILVSSFLPRQLAPIISILPVLSGIIILPARRTLIIAALAALAASISVWKIISPPELVLSQYKDLSKAMLLPEARVTLQKNSPYGFIEAITSPVLRYAPGLSLTATEAADVNTAVFTNADWFGVVAQESGTDTSMVLDYTTFALPYAMAGRRNVLVLRAGTGMDVAHAHSRNVEKIVAVEPNGVVVAALKNELATANDSLFWRPSISVHALEPRTFLLRDTGHYDLIVLPVVGSFGGVAGLHALHEQYMLTKESFRDMWSRLDIGGVISVTSWLDYPLRNPLKILATMAELLEQLQVPDPQRHLAAVRSWGTITFVLSKSPLSDSDIRNTRAFCETMRFDPALLPGGVSAEERSRYNALQDDRLFSYMDKILSAERNVFYRNYDFNIRPATDDKPYFSQFLRWKSLQRLAAIVGNRAIPFFEIGYLLVVVTLVQITLISFVLILLPLFKLGWRTRNKTEIILYFGGIGLGFMFVEMVLIQRFILYLGNPVYAAAAVIALLLIFSGAGSYTADFFKREGKNMVIMLSAIVLILLAYSVGLTPLLQQTVDLPVSLKVATISLLTIPLAFCMGLPFPTGISQVARKNAAEIPWAWGVNGCVSVISTALATIVAVEIGFRWVMWVAAAAYGLALMIAMKWSSRAGQRE